MYIIKIFGFQSVNEPWRSKHSNLAFIGFSALKV